MLKLNWLAGALVMGLITLVSAASVDANGRRRDCPPPCPPQTIILNVCHPCTGCQYDIPVCIPGCVQGAPCVRFERTLIGHGRTVFEWSCGHRVIVRYPHGGGYRVVNRD